ncbi:DNA polymerase [Pyruvatibacter sp.]
MARYIFDLESDGLIPEMTQIHSLVLYDLDQHLTYSCCSNPDYKPEETETSGPIYKLDIKSGLELLRYADEIIGHNIQGFDVPAIQKVYPWFIPQGKITDTLILSNLIYSDIKNQRDDFGLKERGILYGFQIGRHSLEVWGLRMGFHKDDYKAKAKEAGRDPWAEWWPTMQTYCERDVVVTHRLYQELTKAWGKLDQPAIELEHKARLFCEKIEKNGFPFDRNGAANLYAELCAIREDLNRQLKTIFEPWWRPKERKTVSKTRNVKRPDLGEVTIRRFSEKTGKELKPYVGPVLESYEEGAVYTKVELHEFSPSSRADIENRLKKMRGWKPRVFTESGAAKLDDEVLSSLPFPEAKQLARLFLVDKRIGQVAEGKQAWLKKERDGFIYHRVNSNGTVTGRASHTSPNIAQVPSVSFSKEKGMLFGEEGEWGAESRALFRTHRKHWTMVGADMSGLELRCLAHFMARYDDGAYIKEVLEGDVHKVNQLAAGLPTRDMAKTFIYAFLYGAGDAKIGSIVGKGSKAGKQLKERFLAKTPAIAKLRKQVEKAARRKFLIGLDKRRIPIRSAHAALNSLLQSAGAVLCKEWMVLFDQALSDRGYTHGWDGDYAVVAWVHDELQIMCRKEIAEEVGQVAVECCALAGEHYDFRCPLTGEFKIGDSWRDTH